jgi:hypothetical protein
LVKNFKRTSRAFCVQSTGAKETLLLLCSQEAQCARGGRIKGEEGERVLSWIRYLEDVASSQQEEGARQQPPPSLLRLPSLNESKNITESIRDHNCSNLGHLLVFWAMLRLHAFSMRSQCQNPATSCLNLGLCLDFALSIKHATTIAVTTNYLPKKQINKARRTIQQ